MEPQLPFLMATGALTYAPDHQNGTLPVDHAVKLPRELEGGRLQATFPSRQKKGEPRSDLVGPQHICCVLIPSTTFPVPEAHKI